MDLLYVVIGALLAVMAGLALVLVMTRLKLPVAWIRKLSHLGSMAGIIAVSLIVTFKVFIVVGIIFAIILLLVKLIHPPKALADKEALESYGEVYFFVGVSLTALIAPSMLHFIIPIAILGLADTAAYIVGRSISSPKLIFSKTIAGSLAFMIVAFFLLLIAAPWQIALIGSVVTAIAEIVGLRGSDNITIPLVAVLILMIG